MTREQFKLRMQALKAFKELNPDKGYWEWRNSLPDNLRYGDDYFYDMKGAYEAGLLPEWNEYDQSYHLGSRDPITGRILKKFGHDTFYKAIDEDYRLGYEPYSIGTEVYTRRDDEGPLVPWKIESYDNGGEVIPDNSTVRVNPITGKPLASGRITPLFDLETAAGFTPIGDAMSVKDMYDAIKDLDWTGLGLAALGVLPFVPSGIRGVRKANKKFVPAFDMSVNPDYFSSKLENNIKKALERSLYIEDIANAKNRIFEEITSPLYISRAMIADSKYNTNYLDTYNTIKELYENNFFSLPYVYHDNLPGETKGMLRAKKDAAREYFKGNRYAPGPEDFEMPIDTEVKIDPWQMVQHELNHYTDFIISRNPNTTINNNLLSQIEKSLKPIGSNSVPYFRKGTELKAYMNLFRRKLYEDGVISDIDMPVSSYKLKKELDKLPESSSIKKAFNEHKSLNQYTKWFNSVPLLGLSPFVINGYYTQEETK